MAVAPRLTIGTRGSPLALAQAFETKRLLSQAFHELADDSSIEIKKIMTKGDSILNQALSDIGGKGLFTKELDVALLEGEVDLCVHSMKDVPTVLVGGTTLPCNLVREKTNDVFICPKYESVGQLPDGAVVGSASLRRKAQLLAANPTLEVVTFRGNVQTRLKKVDNGLVDATLLALAGIKRLGMNGTLPNTHVMSWTDMLPAVAQGAIGIQCREGDHRVLAYLDALNHQPTKAAVDCERSFLAQLDGNCRTPIAGQAYFNHAGKLNFQGLISKPDGTDMLRVTVEGGDASTAQQLGDDAGREIRRIAGNNFESYQMAVLAHQEATGRVI